MAITSGRLVSKSDLPVLPTVGEANEIDKSTEMQRLRESGNYLWAVGADGDWIEIPLDESGLPMYERVIPKEAPKKRKGK